MISSATIRIRTGTHVWLCYPTVRGVWLAICEQLGLTVQSERYSEMLEDIDDTLDMIHGEGDG